MGTSQSNMKGMMIGGSVQNPTLLGHIPNNQSNGHLSDLAASFTNSESLLSMASSHTQPYFILGIKKKTTKSDFIYDEVYEDITFADHVTESIYPYALCSTTTLSSHITIDDFPIELKKMISNLERQDILQSLELTCLQSNMKRWHLISECSKLSYHYRYIFWSKIIYQLLQYSYQQWINDMEDLFGEATTRVLHYLTIVPFYFFLILNLIFVGISGLILDLVVARMVLRGLAWVHHQLYDAMMLYPEYSTSLVDECIKEDLEKVAITLERMYSNQIEVVVSTERTCLNPVPPSSENSSSGTAGVKTTTNNSNNNNHPQHYYEEYDLSSKRKAGIYYEERFLLYFYPVQNNRLMNPAPGQTNINMDTIYYSSSNNNLNLSNHGSTHLLNQVV